LSEQFEVSLVCCGDEFNGMSCEPKNYFQSDIIHQQIKSYL
jgi:hypothetical protein